MEKRVVIAGGSGFIGSNLAKFLKEKEYEVFILTRSNSRTENGIHFVHWDGAGVGKWAEVLEGSRAIINLAGKSINCIHTEKNKRDILLSRIRAVEAIHQAIEKAQNPPKVAIQASAIGIYGNSTTPCDESSPLGDDFVAHVCKQWEAGFLKPNSKYIRKVVFRIGIVLGKGGGALKPLATLTKGFLGGTVGSGKQYISWVHIDDMNRMIVEAMENEGFHGIYNSASPEPMPNREFMKILRKVIGRPWSPPTPSLFVKIGGYLMLRTEPSLVLEGQHCVPKRLIEEGFVFKYNNLETALKNLV